MLLWARNVVQIGTYIGGVTASKHFSRVAPLLLDG